MTAVHPPGSVRSLIPARIDRLPWSPFHTRMVVALGTAWILDGLEITIASNVGDKLTDSSRLGLSATAVGGLATAYLIGQVVGALVFGHISDRLGRRRLFMITLAIYFGGSALTAFTVGSGGAAIAFIYLTRFVAGAGIGGEYAAINSAIDELIPASYRGRVDIAVNGTYWAGAAIAAVVQVPLLSGALSPAVDWRVAFLLGPVLGIAILFLRRHLPESPRWQIMHGRGEEAERSIAYIEQEVAATGRELPPVDERRAIEITPTDRTGHLALLRVLFRTYPGRSTLGATLMITQSFLYNAIFFTYATVLGTFFGVQDTALYYIPFAIGNFLGPLLLGPLFDSLGRKPMISGTYVLSGGLLVISAFLFRAGMLTATTQTIAWCVIFFFASAGASAAYLTVSEVFPMEVRAKAIAVFFAIAQAFGSIAPLFYGSLIDKNAPDPSKLFLGYLVGAAIMIVGGLVTLALGVKAEGQSLEDVAKPLSVVRATGAAGT
ncbi:MFS transporter [Actinomycetospora soli]|uniref:MFS transporter n=1 Tax=Actinomycetospora soli TaxID=2893887 RepID=UPI001E5F5AE8|nr:MFS transporter [Actinomycetospora soli]MCD2187184.1 MFS transporter [Actinomycetospora soli]